MSKDKDECVVVVGKESDLTITPEHQRVIVPDPALLVSHAVLRKIPKNGFWSFATNPGDITMFIVEQGKAMITKVRNMNPVGRYFHVKKGDVIMLSPDTCFGIFADNSDFVFSHLVILTRKN